MHVWELQSKLSLLELTDKTYKSEAQIHESILGMETKEGINARLKEEAPANKESQGDGGDVYW